MKVSAGAVAARVMAFRRAAQGADQVGAAAGVLADDVAGLADRQVDGNEDQQRGAEEVEQLPGGGPAADDQVGEEPERQVQFEDQPAEQPAPELLRGDGARARAAAPDLVEDHQPDPDQGSHQYGL